MTENWELGTNQSNQYALLLGGPFLVDVVWRWSQVRLRLLAASGNFNIYYQWSLDWILHPLLISKSYVQFNYLL